MKQSQALHVMLSGESVFLTGPPGAGKTYVLNEFIRRAKREGKLLAVTASTGIAATHINGTTIHSWSGLGIRDQLNPGDYKWLAENERLVKRYNGTDILIIDEVSMLHGKRLDMVNEVCKLLRKSDEPFGGLQVILVGDLFQLPPINRGDSSIDFVHTSAAWEELDPKICYLEEQHRQQGGGLLDVLEAMRRGELEDFHAELLEGRMNKTIDPFSPVTRLYSHNMDVDSINTKHLNDLPSAAKTFSMQTRGTAQKIEQLMRGLLAPEKLELKVGAEVMFVANNFAAGFVNGTRGTVVSFQNSMPIVRLAGKTKEVKVEPHTWMLEEDGKKRAEAVQLPLRLAWAITIHKSQGMSLDAAQIDLSKSFTPGMGYVALSRVRSLEGLYLMGINQMAMRLHPDIYDLDTTLQRSSRELAATVPEELPPEPTEDESPAIDEKLYTNLKIWRLARASADGVPPYVVAHNSLLEAVAIRKPKTRQDLLGLPGFGAKKVEKYGDDILRLLGHEPEVVKEKTATNWSKAEDKKLINAFMEHRPLKDVMAELGVSPEEAWDRLAKLIGTEQKKH